MVFIENDMAGEVQKYILEFQILTINLDSNQVK